jgi:hypothetical protein
MVLQYDITLTREALYQQMKKQEVFFSGSGYDGVQESHLLPKKIWNYLDCGDKLNQLKENFFSVDVWAFNIDKEFTNYLNKLSSYYTESVSCITHMGDLIFTAKQEINQTHLNTLTAIAEIPMKAEQEFEKFTKPINQIRLDINDLIQRYSKHEISKIELALHLNETTVENYLARLGKVENTLNQMELSPLLNRLRSLEDDFKNWYHSALKLIATLDWYYSGRIEDMARG